MMDLETRRLYYNRCRPGESLEPDDERNVNLDAFGKDGEQARGVNWVDRLAGRLELSDQPVFELFTGLPGSGKSTELRRLVARLVREDSAHLLPVIIDAEEVLDIHSPIDIPDILAALLYEVEVCVLQAEKKDPADALKDGYVARLWAWLTRTNITFKEAEFSIPEAAKLVVEMKTRPTLREQVRRTIAGHFTTFLNEARDELSRLDGRARDMGYRGIVVIFDSLEKLRGITTNWSDVLGSAERIFAGGAPYLQVPVHVIYTIPTALVLRRFEQVEFMPMIKLRSKEGVTFQPGVDAARELVRKRMPDEVLHELLGPKTEKRVEELILWSGGYPRAIVQLLQQLLMVQETPISDAEFDRVHNWFLDGYRKIIPAEAFDWLAGVALTHYLTIENDAQRRPADLMLSNNAVVRYLNSGDWFDLHPAVYEIPGVRAAIERLKADVGGA